ncbi:MAG: Creatinase/Prolidase N-terminal domain, partial [Chloroflexi bacterium]|nr:Creatinase/Prolidase N-terminal domain [Chloroflexota bacterium]
MSNLLPIGHELARLREALAADGIGAVLLSEPASICYVSGFTVPLSIGAGGSFAGGPNIAGVSQSGSVLFVSASEAGPAGRDQTLDSLLVYNSFGGHLYPLDPADEYRAGLRQLLDMLLPIGARTVLGIEPRTFPAIALTYLTEHYPLVTLRDATA